MIPVLNPVNVPARVLDRYWVESLSLERDPETAAITLSYSVCLGDADGFVISSKNRLRARQILDANQNFTGDDITLGNIKMLLAAIDQIVQADLQVQNISVLDPTKIVPVQVIDPVKVLVVATPVSPVGPI